MFIKILSILVPQYRLLRRLEAILATLLRSQKRSRPSWAFTKNLLVTISVIVIGFWLSLYYEYTHESSISFQIIAVSTLAIREIVFYRPTVPTGKQIHDDVDLTSDALKDAVEVLRKDAWIRVGFNTIGDINYIFIAAASFGFIVNFLYPS